MNKSVFLSVPDIKSLPVNVRFETRLLVRKIALKTGKSGTKFLQVEVGDSTDSFVFNVFEGPLFAFFQKYEETFPFVTHLIGFIEFYGDRFSPRIVSAELVSSKSAKFESLLENLIEKPEESLQLLEQDFNKYIQCIQSEPLKATVQQVFKDLGDSFFSSVAAVSMHHAYLHGLLEHTVHVTRAAYVLLPLYPKIDADLVIAGALLHDVGKVLEYSYKNAEGIQRTRLGRLQGHVVLGYRLVRSAGLRQKLPADLQERLEHIILSHQGEPEWGAAVFPSTPEAVLVSLVDNLDAKMGMVSQQLRKAITTQEFSDFVPGLQTSLLTAKIASPSPLEENLSAEDQN